MMLRSILSLTLVLWVVLIGHTSSGGQLRHHRMKRDSDTSDVVAFKLTQKLDHFDDENDDTWKQRYFMNDTFYQEGGPVFVLVEGEGDIVKRYVKTAQWIEWAEKFHAICFYVEHRFYGESQPTDDLSLENLKYLTNEQALADLAEFYNFASKKHNLQGAKWIFFGGSHAGALVTWFQLKYPHMADGVVASSATVNKVVNDKEYLEIAANVLANVSSTCVPAIRKAFDQMEELIAEGPDSWDKITYKFKLCDPLIGNKSEDLSQLYNQIALEICNIIQYNNNSELNTIESMCEMMDNVKISSELDRLGKLFTMLRRDSTDDPCTSFSYEKYLKAMRDTSWDGDAATSGNRQYYYQKCTQVGDFITSDSDRQPFGHRNPLQDWVKRCSDIFKTNFTVDSVESGVDETHTRYSGADVSGHNIIFTFGTRDPWISLKSNTNDNFIYIEGASHCEDLQSSALHSDSPQLVEARVKVCKQIAKWLSLDANNYC